MTKNRNKTAKPVHVGNIIGEILRAYRKDTDEDFVKIWGLWDELIDAAITQNARPAFFKANCLHVNVSCSVWLHQLRYLKEDIMEKINRGLGKKLICDIKFKVGS